MAGGSPEEKHILSAPYQYISPPSSLLHNGLSQGPSLSFSQRENAFLSSSSSTDPTRSHFNQIKRRNEEDEEGQEVPTRDIFSLPYQNSCQEEAGKIEDTLQDFTNVWRNSGGLLGYLASPSSFSSIARAGREFDEHPAPGRKESSLEIVDMESEKKKISKLRDERADRGGDAEEEEGEEGEFLRYCRIFFREQEKQEIEFLRQPLE
ncbi:hypothetical protein CSUI_010233, partial [Cystoisospora suis]